MTIPQRDNFVSSRRRFLQRACAFAGMTAVSPAWAQSLLFIVPLAPGGGLDFIARTIGNYLSSDMGQQIVIKNRSGAGGTIGIDAAAQAPPDGYTVLVINDNIASTPHLLPVAADYSTAFASVIEIARQPQILAVHLSLGVTSLAGLIQLAKRRADLTYATSGAGSNQNILGEWFNRVAGIKLQHVPYRGAGQAIDDVVAGRVPIAILGPTG